MAAEKIASYTDEQVKQIRDMYAQSVAIEEIATAVGKSVRSVVAKLSREGVYKSKVKASAGKAVTKAQLIDQIAAKASVDAEKLESLEKATKEALEVLVAAL